MNSYTRSQRVFTAKHFAVVAKLDVTITPYKYIVFEQEFGAFGLEDDESLEYIINNVLLLLYAGMNYSKIKLVQYGQATQDIYDLLGKMKPILGNLIITNQPVSELYHPLTTAFFPLFFKPEDHYQAPSNLTVRFVWPLSL